MQAQNSLREKFRNSSKCADFVHIVLIQCRQTERKNDLFSESEEYIMENLENVNELDLDALETAAGGTNIVEMDEEDPNLESALGTALLTAAAMGVIKAFAGSFMPDTFDDFWNNVYLPHETAIDVALCASGGLVSTAAYLACDKQKFWHKIYDMLA